MIVLDTSPIAAIFLEQPDHEVFARRMADAARMAISAGSYLELGLVLRSRERGTGNADKWVDALIEEFDIQVEPVTADQVRLARAANARFGKGSGHRAQLNFGDCFAYALAKSLDAPLLYKGTDFSHTDIVSAL